MTDGPTMTDQELAEWTDAMTAGGQRGYALANGVGVHAYTAAPRVRPPAVAASKDAIVDFMMGLSK